MQRISDIPLFDAADYLESSLDCAEFLLDLIHDGSEDDVRRGLAAVARATGRPIGDLPTEVLDALLTADPARNDVTRRSLERLGIRVSDMRARPA